MEDFEPIEVALLLYAIFGWMPGRQTFELTDLQGDHVDSVVGVFDKPLDASGKPDKVFEAIARYTLDELGIPRTSPPHPSPGTGKANLTASPSRKKTRRAGRRAEYLDEDDRKLVEKCNASKMKEADYEVKHGLAEGNIRKAKDRIRKRRPPR